MAKAILRLLPEDASVTGKVFLDKDELTSMTENQLRSVRWTRISVVTQSSMNALDPVFRISQQFLEAFRAHDPGIKRDEALGRVVELFELVGISPTRLHDYPHQLSGGMKQRVVIALALALNPSVIIADEPTTALDVIMQDQIMARIQRIHKELRKSMVLITHDMALIAENCDKVVVMYAGQVSEIGSVLEMFKSPFHPYTMGLRQSFPNMQAKSPLISIPGAPPMLTEAIRGCRFAPRCPFVTSRCQNTAPPLIEVNPGHFSRCHYPEHAEAFRLAAADPARWSNSRAIRN